MSKPKSRFDGWRNFFTGHGTKRDKRTAGTIFTGDRCRFHHKELSALYHNDYIANTIATLPAKEMTRQWIKFAESDTEAESEFKRLKVRNVFFLAEMWSRVFGTSLVFMDFDDSMDLEEPASPTASRGLRGLHVFDRTKLHVQEYYTAETIGDVEGGAFKLGRPRIYQVVDSGAGALRSSISIHESRFIRFDATITTDRRMRNNEGWADSVYERMYDILRDFGMAWGSIGNLMTDLQQAVMKFRGLNDALINGCEGDVQTRLEAIDLFRSTLRAIPMDADDEDFVRVATPFTGIPEMLREFNAQISAAARIPLRKLFGQGSSGLGAEGGSSTELRMFYDEINAAQEDGFRPKLVEVMEKLGLEPVEFEFLPLWQMDAKDKADVMLKAAQADASWIANQVLTPEEVAMSRFGGDEFNVDIELDESLDREGFGQAAREMTLPASLEGVPDEGFGEAAAEGQE